MCSLTLILGLSFQKWRVGRQALPRGKKKCLLNTQGKSIGALGLVFKTVPTAQAGVGPLLHTSSTAGSQMLGYRYAQHVQPRDGSCAK